MIISKGIGIDLGTTNSAVAVMNITDTDVLLYADNQARSTVPSCVWRKQSGGPVIVGHEAYVRRQGRPEPVISIKRKMGTSLLTALGPAKDIPENVPEALRRRLVEGQEARLQQRMAGGNGRKDLIGSGAEPPLLWLPEEISACIVNEMGRRMSQRLDQLATAQEKLIVDRGIITVPAYFDMNQIEATREAGRMAGIEVIDLLHEPTAAAVYHSWRHRIPDGVFLVYDLGGGTFDVSILRRTSGEFEVLGISGDNFLGGDDFDRLLAEWIRVRLSEEYLLDLKVDSDPEDGIRFRRLTALAEGVKMELSKWETFLLRDQNTLRDQRDEQLFIEMEIRRSDFEQLIQDKIVLTLPKIWEALARAYRHSGITLKDVDHVLLVGGSTNIPLVQQVVRQHLCRTSGAAEHQSHLEEQIMDNVDDEVRETVRHLLPKRETAKCAAPDLDSPGTCVAMGAAIRAAAAGTVIQDDQHRVRIHFRSQSATSSGTCDLAGFIQDPGTGKPLAGAALRLTDPEGRLINEKNANGDGYFRFPRIALPGNGVTAFGVSVHDPSGQLLAQLGRKVEQTDEHRDIGSVLSTAILSKPIALELMNQGRLVRGILLDEGQSLPAMGPFRFFVRDESGVIRFPLHHGNRLIREVTARINRQVPVGTPVDLEIQCDEQMCIRLNARIGEQVFQVDVGPPPPPAPPNEEDQAELLHRFQERIADLDEEDQRSFSERFEATLTDLQLAMAAGDHPKAISKFADLEALLKAMSHRAPRLQPPWRVVERGCEQLLELTTLADLLLDSSDMDESRARLAEYRRSAQSALAAGDQQLYSEAIEKLRAFGENFRKRLAELMPDDQSEQLTDEQRAIMACASLARGIEMNVQVAFASGRIDLVSQLQTMHNEVRSKETEAASAPREILRWCQQVHNELNRFSQQLGAKESTIKTEGLLDRRSSQLWPLQGDQGDWQGIMNRVFLRSRMSGFLPPLNFGLMGILALRWLSCNSFWSPIAEPRLGEESVGDYNPDYL